MMLTTQAVYKNGVLKPLAELDLPENTTVHLVVTPLTRESSVSEQPTPFATLHGIWSQVHFPESIELTLQQMRQRSAEKLERLAREKVAEILLQLEKRPNSLSGFHFEFIILADGQEVWRGQDAAAAYTKIRRQYPEAQLSLSWQSSPVTLV
jgi:predicted DNA-binding antitoxin AbrB/MazE fold protein